MSIWLPAALLPALLTAPESEPSYRPATSAEAQGWHAVSAEPGQPPSHLRSERAGAVLRFTLSLAQPTRLAVSPRWAEHGQQLPATRFPALVPWFAIEQSWPMATPYPRSLVTFPHALQRRYGPDVVDVVGDRLYFTAPDSGRLGVVQLSREAVVQVIDVDGYPADLVADAAAGRVYVADAARDRVLAYDAATGALTAQCPVPALPRSLALHDGRLYVATMTGRQIVVLKAADLSVQQRLSLPFVPQHVAVIDGALRVWPLPGTFDPVSLAESPADRLAYWPTHRFPSGFETAPTRYESLARTATGTLNIVARMNHPDTMHVQTPQVRLGKGPRPNTWTAAFPATEPSGAPVTIDFSGLLAAPEALGRVPAGLPATNFPGPYAGVAGKLYFAVPASGQVGVLPLGSTAKLNALSPGGYLADVVSFNGLVLGKYLDCQLSYLESLGAGALYSQGRKPPLPKVYVADTAGHQVLVIDPATDRIVREIAVAREPVKLSLYGLDLFVACRAGREVAVIDITTDQIVRRLPLPAEPVYVDVAKLQPEYNASEFPPPAERDESPLRVLLHYQPPAFDLAGLKPVAARPLDLAECVLYRRRSEVTVPGAQPQRILADNLHTLRFGTDRHLDLSAVTDPRHLPEPARLRAGDTPGTLTLRVDGGPAHDWSREVWLEPTTRQFTARGSDDHRRQNAPVFDLPAGRHVLEVTAHNPYAQLAGLEFEPRLPVAVAADLRPLPEAQHSAVKLSGYGGVFAAGEPPRFRLDVTGAGEQPLRLTWSARHPMDGEGDAGTAALRPSGGRAQCELAPKLKGTGVYELRVTLTSSAGRLDLRRVFLCLPELSRPRLLYRAADREAIAQRVRQHAVLFRRYRAWLERHAAEDGFLPTNLTGSGQETKLALQRWRALAALFCEVFVPAPDRPLLARLKPVIKGHASGGWTPFQGDYQFGSALAMLWELVAVLEPQSEAELPKALGATPLDERLLPETLAAVQTPLTPAARAALAWQVVSQDNYLRYWRAHQGSLGGMLWQGQRSWCACSIHSVARNQVLLSNALADRRMVDQGHWPGFFTHLNYTLPIEDKDKVITPGGAHGPNPVMDMVITSLIRHPLEKHKNGFNEVLAKLDGPLPDETSAVDAVLGQGANGLVPLALALGWYDPAAPEVNWSEIPRGLYFDGEGAVAMRSEHGPELTEIYFVSGVRDVSYRTQPNHLQVFKAGRMLLGTAAMAYDHGTPTPSWANSVIVGEQIPAEWLAGTGYARGRERRVINRADPYVLPQIAREQRRSGITPQTVGSWFVGGHAGPGVFDLVLHSHTRHPFVEQGAIRAWQTRPEFDYACGDSTNAQPVEQVEELYRQVVYLRPDLLVVFDRGQLAPNLPNRWVASVGPRLELARDGFTVVNKEAWLAARVLQPAAPVLTSNRFRTLGYDGGPIKLDQKLLSITTAQPVTALRYLVVMRLGTGAPQPVPAELVERDGLVGARLVEGGRPVEVLFRPTGQPGGEVRLGSRTCELPRGVDYTLRHWQGDARYARWLTEPGFREFLPPVDRR